MNGEIVGRFVFLTSGIYLNLKRNIEALLSPCNLTFAQYGVLSVIGGKQRLNQKRIADTLDTDTTNVMVIVDALQKKGYVKRERDSSDRRSKIVTPTPTGARILKEAGKIITQYERDLKRQVEPEEIAKTLPLLETIYRYFKESRDS